MSFQCVWSMLIRKKLNRIMIIRCVCKKRTWDFFSKFGNRFDPGAYEGPPPEGGHPWGALLILHLLAFPFLRQFTLHCNTLHSPSDRIVYLNIVKKGTNIFSKKGFLRWGTTFFSPPLLLHKCSRKPLFQLFRQVKDDF